MVDELEVDEVGLDELVVDEVKNRPSGCRRGARLPCYLTSWQKMVFDSDMWRS